VIAVPGSPPGARAAKAATSTIPIIFGIGEDPVATGINFLTAEVIAKRLALLHELVPGAARVAALINPTDAVRAEAVRNDLQSAVRTMGVQLQIFTASSGLEIDTAFAAVARERADALFVGGSLFHPNRVRRARICRCGRLISYGTSVADMYRQVGI
jgi:putative ABC transport system substrate-binding protein